MESGTFENEGRPDLGGLDASGDHGTSSALSGEVNGHGHGEHGRICDVSGCAMSFPSMEKLKAHLEDSHIDGMFVSLFFSFIVNRRRRRRDSFGACSVS